MNKKHLLSLSAAVILGVSQAFAVTEYWVAPNGNDDNPGSQAKPFQSPEMAIMCVLENDETIIHFQKDATFILAGQLDLKDNKKVTLIGDNTTLKGAAKPGFEGGEAMRIFRAAKNCDITISGINFVNGRQVGYFPGGAIFFTGEELKIDHCRFIDNEAGSGGGAICSRGRIVRVSNSYFEHNYILGGGAYGGAILQRGPETMDGELYVDNCTFYKNSLEQGGQGTAIAVYDPSTQDGVNFVGCQKVQVVNSTFVENTSADNYQACVDLSGGTDTETILANNTFYNNDGALRFYFQLAPVYMFNNFAYCNRACVLSELSIAEADRMPVVAHNNILYGAERAVNEYIDDPDLNDGAAAAHNTLGLCKDATMAALGVSTNLSTHDEAFVPYLQINRENSPLAAGGIATSEPWLDPNVIPEADVRGKSDVENHVKSVGAFDFYGTGGIEAVYVDADNSNAPVEYYNLQGIRVLNPERGIYIRRQGTQVTKVKL